MSNFFIKFIVFYQKIKLFLIKNNFIKKQTCVFFPTCSEYAKQAFKKYGFLKGFLLSFKRIIRCHPFVKNHIDKLP